jgi:hypothetical protein
MKFSPTTDRMPSTPGIGRTMSSTSLTTLSVRLSETPSGSRSAAKIAPWSSSGRKLCGVLLNSHAEAASTPTTTTTPMMATRTSRRTTAT